MKEDVGEDDGNGEFQEKMVNGKMKKRRRTLTIESGHSLRRKKPLLM